VISPQDAYWRNPDWRELWLALGGKLEVVSCGGAQRAESVLNGLFAAATAIAPDDWVLVHDAARPCLSGVMLDRLIETLAEDPVGGLLAAPCADTLKRADAANRVAATIPRVGLWQAQTPQMFRYDPLLAALQAHKDVTDEAGAMEAAGFSPRLVEGMASNLKVTRPEDLSLAAWILHGRNV
jgi:2-C-methyl-D-erythritol 4-phosphate cytidylyltransferase